MRLALGRMLGTALVGLALSGASACTQATPIATPWPTGSTLPTTPADPTASAAPTASSGSSAPAGSATPARTRNPKIAAACDAVLKARKTAVEALSPVLAVLVQSGLTADDLAKATNDLNAVYTAMHVGVATAAELTSDAQLKAKITAYQYQVEQAIVAVESSDSEQAKLKAVIESPALRSAEKAVLTACG